MPFNDQIDYFHFDHSVNNTNNNYNNNKLIEEYNWTEYPDFCSTEQYQRSMSMMQVSDQIQYINPALLHM